MKNVISDEFLFNIGKEIQTKILNDTQLRCVIHIDNEYGISFLFGLDWYIYMDNDDFIKINGIITEYHNRYPNIIEEGISADCVSPTTEGWIDQFGKIINSKEFKVLTYIKLNDEEH